MKRLFAFMVLAALVISAHALVSVKNEPLGSGVPGEVGSSWAIPVLENNIYHAPGYLPYHPTAATIYPRVIEVPCTQTAGITACDGYNWSPEMGRAEYLFFTPKAVKPPVTIIKEVPGPERIILKEVPIKKPKE